MKQVPSRWEKDKGKWAEGKVQPELEKLAAQYAGFAWHRMPDAKAARGALSAQPADWITAMKYPDGTGTTVWLECKETAEEKRLPRAKVSQFPKLRMFWMASNSVRVIVYRSLYQDWIVFDELDLFMQQELPTSFPFAGKRSFETAAEAVHSIYLKD